MDGRSRVLSDVSETELLDDEKFEDAVESLTDLEVPTATGISSERKRENIAQTIDPENEIMSKSDQESTEKAKQSGTRERRFKEMRTIQSFEASITKKPIWCMKFSHCGRFLATGGADCEVRVWITKSYLHQLEKTEKAIETEQSAHNTELQGFSSTAYVIFKGHKNEILDIVWTEDYNLLSCSMDKDVRVWSMATKACLVTLRHDSMVSSAKLLPKNRNFLATITCEGFLRLWDVPHRKVAGEIKVHDNLCTALEVIEEDSIIVIGTTDGKCLFFTKTLAAHSTLTISDKKPKIFDICSFGDKMLVSTDDSKTRMYNNKTRHLLMKFNGAPHLNSLTRANFSPDSQVVISGAEDYCLYFWSTAPPLPAQKNEVKQMEKIKVGKVAITVAMFAPRSEAILKEEENTFDAIICADCIGNLTVMTGSLPEL